jgi:hypothetical protein
MSVIISSRKKSLAVIANRVVLGISRHWLLIFVVISGLYAGLPWLAPVFMKIGWMNAGNAIYMFYSTQCHQLPQRSFFLFGEKTMYSLSEVQALFRNTTNPHILRQFIGDQQVGWKMAWSDRMVSLYTTIFFAGLFYPSVRKHLKPLPIRFWTLLAMPLFIDVGAHMASDMAGIGKGFRDSNLWLAALTGNSLPPLFYAGDGLGSFNSWIRLVTGILFGISSVWMFYPRIEQTFAGIINKIETKFEKAGISL